jgi:16S rRNA processing protein RimM
VPSREITLESHWLHKGRVVLKFAGIDSINDAEGLRGFDVVIPASERAELNDGSVYISDLIGCEVVDLASEAHSIGTIADVDRQASLLIVQPAKGGEHLIPFAQAYLVKIDVAAKRVEMRLPEGLLEINAPVADEEHSQSNQSSDDGE